MASERARPRAPPFIDPPGYARHRPEATLLYQLVERHYPEFVAAARSRRPAAARYVQEEFEAYLKCGRLEHGFLRVRCEDCHAEKLVAFSCKRRGFCLLHAMGIRLDRDVCDRITGVASSGVAGLTSSPCVAIERPAR